MSDALHSARTRAALPQRAGAGFKPLHAEGVFDSDHEVSWFEIHPENYMGEGGPMLALLETLRARYPLSIHGVGLSIGGARDLDRAHLKRLRGLIDRFQPGLFSEHLAWSTHEDAYFNDLLPLPYTRQTLERVCDHIDETQEALGRRMLLENPSTYVIFETSEMEETEFLAEIARRTGCGLLLDVNNVFVSATNHGWSAEDYLDRFPVGLVGEVHLAGHKEVTLADGARLLIDSHDRTVSDPVWALYGRLLDRTGPLPTLIEWDADVPPFSVLAGEAAAANRFLERASAEDPAPLRLAAGGRHG